MSLTTIVVYMLNIKQKLFWQADNRSDNALTRQSLELW